MLVARGFKKNKKNSKNLPLQVPPQTLYIAMVVVKYLIYCNTVMYCTKHVYSLILNKVDMNEWRTARSQKNKILKIQNCLTLRRVKQFFCFQTSKSPVNLGSICRFFEILWNFFENQILTNTARSQTSRRLTQLGVSKLH